MMDVIKVLLRAGLVVGAIMSVAGLLALVFPPADFPNHFRPLTLAGCFTLLIVAALLRQRSIAFASAALIAFNGPLVALPLATSAKPFIAAPRQKILKVIAFNIWTHNSRLHDIAQWLEAEDADIVVLQEISARSHGVLRSALAKRYPHIHDCGCNELLVASKRPWIEAGGIGRTDDRPSLNWLRFDDGNGGSWRFVGLRTVYPMRPMQQARHYRWLEREVASTPEPQVLAGDFNLTPWAFQLQRLMWRTGLRRHGTWARSWNAKGSLSPRMLLIDNVLSTPDIRSVSFTTGPNLGSDHLPIVATVALP